MSRRTLPPLVLAALVAVAAVPLHADRRDDAKAQVEFGIKVAQKGLWDEAMHRWQKAVEIDPGYAEAWNDLAVSYEQQGKLDDANKAYQKAIQLAPDNQMIRQNYDLFREIYDQARRHSGG